MDYQNLSRRLLLLFVLSTISNSLDAVDVCSNTILPGSKGDPGERGDEGDQGRQGKTGPPGLIGLTGELGSKGDVGRTGKTGPAGEKGDQGAAGLAGPSGLKGKTGMTCDCGRYRKLVGQLDNTVSKLKNAVKFVKNGIKETEERLYLIVKEARRYREALANCKLRGGSLAMPKTADTNTLIRDYVAQSGLTRVFIGVQRGEKEGGAVYADHTPVRNYTGWGLGEPPGASTNTSCVEMAGTGVWNQVECDVPLYYVCEFKRTRRGGLPSVL